MRFARMTSAVILVGGTFAASCGIPTNRSPQVEAFPDDLLQELPPTTATPTAQPESDTSALSLYFHDRNDQLVRVRRVQAPAINEALQLLVAGPTEEEQLQYLPALILSRLSSNLNPRVSRIDDDRTAYITVADEADFRNDPNRRLGAAELVCTALQYRLVDGVYIEDSQGIIPLTDLEAVPISGPTNATAYENCQPQALAPTTTSSTVARTG